MRSHIRHCGILFWSEWRIEGGVSTKLPSTINSFLLYSQSRIQDIFFPFCTFSSSQFLSLIQPLSGKGRSRRDTLFGGTGPSRDQLRGSHTRTHPTHMSARPPAHWKKRAPSTTYKTLAPPKHICGNTGDAPKRRAAHSPLSTSEHAGSAAATEAGSSLPYPEPEEVGSRGKSRRKRTLYLATFRAMNGGKRKSL